MHVCMISCDELLSHPGCIHRMNSGCILTLAKVLGFLNLENPNMNANISQKSKEKIPDPISVHDESYVNVNVGMTV